MTISSQTVKELRELTQAGVMECKKALKEAGGDLKKAAEILKKRGLEIAQTKASRTTNQGRVEAYVHHGNKIAVLVELNCETDFVARNEDFIQFSKDVAMQVAAANPLYLKEEDVPASELPKDESGKKNLLKVVCLMSQPFIKDPAKTIGDYMTEMIAKTRENISIRRFVRYQLGG